jgi:threonine/homoserine/homoserine lactone efflux protein
MIAQLGGFFAVAAVVIVTPGPDTALTIRNSVAGGRRAGTCTGAGVCAGQVIWAVAATTGLTALLAAWRPGLLVIRIAGAAYLIWLGLSSLRATARPALAPALPTPQPPGCVRPRTAFGQGMLSNLTNPKMAVLFISLLPQFAGPDRSPQAAMLTLGLLFAAMTFTWLACVAVLATRLLREPRARQVLNGMCSAALVGLGVWLAVESGPAS